MSRIKTKRILWTIAALLALSFVAVIVLHKHDEPKVIGNISAKDVSELSKIVLHDVHVSAQEDMIDCIKQGHLISVIEKLKEYTSFEIVSVALEDSQNALVEVGPATNHVKYLYGLLKDEDGWRFSPPSLKRIEVSTNATPVPQSGVVR